MHDLEFEEWFKILLKKLKELGHTEPIDKYEYEFYWEENENPDMVALLIIKEFNTWVVKFVGEDFVQDLFTL